MPQPAITQLENVQLLALLERHLTADTPLQLVDVRTPEEYRYFGHIPGAQLIPLHELPQRWQELDKHCHTVLICEHGVRSMDASYYLSQLGFCHLYNLTTGMAEWTGPREHLNPSNT